MCSDAKYLCSEGLKKNKCGGVTHVNVVYISVSKKKKQEEKIETEKKKKYRKQKEKKESIYCVLNSINVFRKVVVQNE